MYVFNPYNINCNPGFHGFLHLLNCLMIVALQKTP